MKSQLDARDKFLTGFISSQLGHVPKPWSYYWTEAQKLHMEQELPDEAFEDEAMPLPMQSPKCILGSASMGTFGGVLGSHRPVEALMQRSRLGGGGLLGGVTSGGGAHGMAGNSNASSASAYGVPHKYERYSYTTLTTCDFCNGLLWGPKTGVRCLECNYNCHQKCREYAPRTCSGGGYNSSHLQQVHDNDFFAI